jgi:hypothetical protein
VRNPAIKKSEKRTSSFALLRTEIGFPLFMSARAYLPWLAAALIS